MYTHMKYANLNISNSTDSFKYIVSYDDLDGDFLQSGQLQYIDKNGTVNMFCGSDERRSSINLVRSENDWIPYDNVDKTEITSSYIPSSYKLSKLRIYFPNFSVDTYSRGVYYALDVYLKLSHKKINIGSYIISRNDALACDKIERFLNGEYYECFDIVIPNPNEILYQSAWDQFRKEVCGKKFDIALWKNSNIWKNYYRWSQSTEFESNTDIPVLMLALNPICNYNGTYIKKEGYSGGQSFINIMNASEYLGISLSHSLCSQNDKYELVCKPTFNSSFGNIFTYLKDTYFNIIPSKLNLQILVQTKDDLFKLVEHTITYDDQTESDWVFNIFDSNNKLNFDSWDEWVPGLFVQSVLNVYLDEDEDEVMYFKSNQIPITPELFGYMLNKKIDVQYINTKDMNIENLNIVNKIEKKVVQLDSISNSKSHFVKPMFFKSQPISNIVVHPEVTENICLNLDSYKSKVNVFSIQIENTIFSEIGRTNAGILFKVIGSKLPKKIESGSYYVLNDDNEMITSGKYTYEY